MRYFQDLVSEELSYNSPSTEWCLYVISTEEKCSKFHFLTSANHKDSNRLTCLILHQETHVLIMYVV